MMKRDEFQSFYNEWMKELVEILHQLRSVPRHDTEQHRALVHKTMEHYRAYYAANSELVREDVRLVLSPPWLSSFERLFLWMGGWRPSSFFGGIMSTDINEEMRREVRKKEEEVEEEMRSVQDGGVEELMKVERGSVEEGWVMEEVFKGVQKVVVKADGLRMETMRRLAGGMSPVQALEFLGAMMDVLIQVHDCGLAADQDED